MCELTERMRNFVDQNSTGLFGVHRRDSSHGGTRLVKINPKDNEKLIGCRLHIGDLNSAVEKLLIERHQIKQQLIRAESIPIIRSNYFRIGVDPAIEQNNRRFFAIEEIGKELSMINEVICQIENNTYQIPTYQIPR